MIERGGLVDELCVVGLIDVDAGSGTGGGQASFGVLVLEALDHALKGLVEEMQAS